MTKKIALTALSFALALGIAVPAQAEIIDYGYGSTIPGYGTGSFTTISRDLTVGSYGADVQALEAFLASRGYLTSQSVGYFSVATRDGVARFQAASGIFPASGYFGPLTRAFYNAQAGSTQYTQYQYGNQYQYGGQYQYAYQQGCPSGYYSISYNGQVGCVSSSSYDNDDDDDDEDLDGGNATLRRFEVEEGDDADLREGDDDAEIFRASFEVEDGDVRVDRVEVRFEYVGGEEGDDRPWEVFDRVSLLGDRDEIAEVDARDDDEWDEDGDGYVLRFDDLDDYVIREDDEADLRLEVDVASSVDGAGDTRVLWNVSIVDDGIRTIDGDRDREEIGDESETVEVRITER